MTDSEGKAALKTAWGELGSIEKESKRYREIINATEQDLEACRQKGVALEDELPERITSEEERELLGLLCRVHELEADKVSLQAERLARQGELRRRDLQLLRAERQRRLCEDIISTQRKIIEGRVGKITYRVVHKELFVFIVDGKFDLPDELKELYALYQQEIHASIYNGANPGYDIYQLEKLPPLHTRRETTSSSSSGSEWSSPLSEHLYNDTTDPDIVMGPKVAPKVPYT